MGQFDPDAYTGANGYADDTDANADAHAKSAVLQHHTTI